ncbi:MAG: type II secretion system F family protein [Chloroflexota bacterium]
MIWLLVFVLILGGAIALIVVGLRDSQDTADPIQERLAEFAERGETVTLEQIELSQPLSQRVIMPFARKMGEFALRFTPQNALQATSKKLELAGNPRWLDPTVFWGLRFILAIALIVLLLVVFNASKLNWTWGRKLMIVALLGGFGFYIPEMLVNSIIQRRQKSIRKSMPDALDLLTICVEAGLGFDSAMSRVHEKWDNELSLAFGRVIREVQLGKLRREALRDMADRIGIPEMTSFVAAIIQSEQLGVSMAKVLRIQSDQMRVKRRQRAEEEAHKAPIKMLIPMTLLIFPTICIVLMTPAAFRLVTSSLAPMFGLGGG